MGVEYNLEDLKQKLPMNLEAMGDLSDRALPAFYNDVNEVAAETGSAIMIKNAGALEAATQEVVKIMKKLLGEPGDRVSDGTMYGVLNNAKMLDATLNGN